MKDRADWLYLVPLVFVLLVVLLVALFIPGGLLNEQGPTPTPTQEITQTPQPTQSVSPTSTPIQTPTAAPTATATPEPTPAYEYAADISAFAAAINLDISKADLLLVNETYGLDADYVPANLVNLPLGDTGGKEIQLDATAAAALRAMMLCMRADGITNTFVTSAYRSYDYQNRLFNRYLEDERWEHPFMSEQDLRKIVVGYSATPGHSEHQTGLCVDFMTTSMTDLDNRFEQEAACQWLRENAMYFGFILRFPEDKTEITGHVYESWHYRYVGRVRAEEITRAGICLEEYLEQ